MNLDRERGLEIPSDRSFGRVFGVFFAIVALWPLSRHGVFRTWALILSGFFFFCSFFSPGILSPLNRIWNRFGLFLHRMTSPIILGVLFFMIVTPFGMLMRLRGYDPLRLRFETSQKSYWIQREPPGPNPESMRRLF